MSDEYLNKAGLTHFWARIKAFVTGLDNRVTALEQGEPGDENTIESISFNGSNVSPDESKNVAITENDPTVPDWAKATSKPTYTASEVGAISTNAIVNNLNTENAGTVLDGRQGKLLLDALNARVSNAIDSTNYSTLQEAAAAVFENMTSGTVKIGRFARGTAFAYIAMKNSENFATLLCYTYSSANFYVVSRTTSNYTVYSFIGTREE